MMNMPWAMGGNVLRVLEQIPFTGGFLRLQVSKFLPDTSDKIISSCTLASYMDAVTKLIK
jgi:hypothetical protein